MAARRDRGAVKVAGIPRPVNARASQEAVASRRCGTLLAHLTRSNMDGPVPESDLGASLSEGEGSSSRWRHGTSPHYARDAVARSWRWSCHRATAGPRTWGVLVQYVARFETRGRPEGRPDPRSQQVARA